MESRGVRGAVALVHLFQTFFVAFFEAGLLRDFEAEWSGDVSTAVLRAGSRVLT